jgi:hypothetical protein
MRKVPGYLRLAKAGMDILCAGLFLFPVFYLLLSLTILCFVRRRDYSSILHWYSDTWPEAFDVQTMATNCFTPSWYNFLKTYSMAGGALVLILLFLYLAYSRPVWRFCRKFFEETGMVLRLLSRTFRSRSPQEKGILLSLFGLILLYRIYFFSAFPLHTDELCSYLFFARSGPFIAITSYPIPNNHVFFNLFCSLLSRIPYLSPKAVMRLPSMAGDLLLLYGLFCLFTRWGGFRRGIIVVAGVAFCYFTSYFAVQGRGYQWQELCALVSILSCWECLLCGGERRGFALFVVSSVAGFYINPTFAYHFLALILFFGYLLIVRRDRGGLRFFVRGLLIVMMAVALFYLPLILVSGWKALTGNEYVTGAKSFYELAAGYWEFTFLLKDMTYYGRAGMYFFLGTLIVSFLLYRYKKISGPFYFYSLVYFFAVVLALVLLILYTKMYPLERSLCYWILAVNILFVNIVYDVILRFAPGRASWLVAIFLAVKITGSLRGIYWERFGIVERKEVILYHKISKDLKELGGLHPANWQITNSDDFYSMYLKEYLIECGGTGKVILDRVAARAQVLFLPDLYRPSVDLRGYILWKDKRITVVGETPADKTLSIYVARTVLRP